MDYTLKKWSSLSALHDTIQKSKGGEKVVKFNGKELWTNKYRYGLSTVLTRTPIKELKDV
jgi:hypothetical protein